MKDKIIECIIEIADEFNLVLLSEEIVYIATRIMELPQSKEECANYARYKAVTDGEIEEAMNEWLESLPKGPRYIKIEVLQVWKAAVKWMRDNG